jgi:hypothetical protein
MMEGVTSEAASLAGTLGLGKLIVLYDSNNITIEGSTDIAFRENVAKRFEAYGWQTLRVEDGTSVADIDAAIKAAKAETTKPTLIVVKTLIGYGSPKQGLSAAHGEPLGADNIKAAKVNLGWEYENEFHVPEEVREHAAQVMENVTSTGVQLQRDRMTCFSMCLFDFDYAFQYDMYKKLSYYPENVQKLFDYLKNSGYTLEPSKPAQRCIYGKKNIGELTVVCSVEFLPQFKNQLMFSFMSDKDVIKDCLQSFSSIDENVKALLYSKIKKCNACGFCNQTNKNRPLLYIEANYNNEDIRFCYHFQHIRFSDMDDKALREIISFYDFLDERYKNYKA